MKLERAFWVGFSLTLGFFGTYAGFHFGESMATSNIHSRVRYLSVALHDMAEDSGPECSESLRAVANLAMELTQPDSEDFYRALGEFESTASAGN